MARSRHSRMEIIGGNQYETFSLERKNKFVESTFKGIRTRQYTVKIGDRLDHIAARFLNEDEYWWVIALVNDLVSPFIKPGQKLKIPFDIKDVLERM